MSNEQVTNSGPILFPGQLAAGTPFVVPGIVSRKIASGDAAALAAMPLVDALHAYLESHSRTLHGRTPKGYAQAIKMLSRFFGDKMTKEIHVGHMEGYQEARLTNAGGRWKRPAGPSLINHELSLIQQVLKRAGLWGRIAGLYRPLPLMPLRPRKVLSDIEERRLFAVAASDPSWELVYLVATLTANTTSAGVELRNLRFEDVILDGEPRLIVDPATAKNVYRGRSIPLNSAAQEAARRCIARALKLGSRSANHYIFPFRTCRGRWDPTRPASESWLRRSWGGLREAAGLPWLTPHCLRHQHITLSVEAGEPIEQIALRVGHVSPNMTRWYLSARPATQCAAVDKLDPSVRFGSNNSQMSKTAAMKVRCFRFRQGPWLEFAGTPFIEGSGNARK